MIYARRATAPLLGLPLLLSAHCSAPPSPADGGDAALDATVDATMQRCESTFTFETGDPQGHAEPLRASASEARAGRLNPTDLPPDPTGLATWAPGDYVLANDHVALIIEAARRSQLYDPWGGKPVGLARVRDGRLVEPADFNELIFGPGLHTIEPESVTVLRDGSGGGPAVVRVVGTFRRLPFIAEFSRPLAPFDYSDIRAAIDYELQPGADHVDVYVTYDVRRTRPTELRPYVHAFFQHYRMRRWSPGIGFTSAMENTPVAAFVDDRTMSYAWMSADSDLSPLISQSGFDSYTSATFTLPPCTQTRRHTARLVMGGPGLDGLVQSLARVRNERLREVRGTVTESGGSPAVGVRVHATSPDGATYYTRALSGSDGSFVLHVPEASAVRVSAFRAGDGLVGPVDAPVGTSNISLRMPAAGFIHVTTTDSSSGQAMPARVQVIPMGTPPAAPPGSFGEQTPGAGRTHVTFPNNGEVTLRATPGTYRVIVSHGYEYEVHEASLTLRAGETANVSASLRHSVDTTNVMCGDFHIHTSRSPDAEDDARHKLSSLIADGLEIPVRSDHEFVADFQPLIQDMGLERWAFGVPSLELTTFTWGHFGVVPLPPDPTMRNGGAFEWAFRTPPQVFAEVRERASAPTIIINHPRAGAAPGAYFTAARFDPATGVAGRAEYWDEAFTAVEVFNDSDFESNRMGTVRDWFGLLAHGRRVFAVGSSDSHSVASSPVGYPRTCMYLGTDDPRTTSQQAVRDAVARGRSTISGGIYVSAEGPGGVGPGQEATGVGTSARVRVTVQAATWVSAQRLEVIVDGTTVQTIPLDGSTADPMNPVVRLRRDIDIPVAAGGSWVVFVAHSDRDLEPVHPGRRAFGVTNPVFLRP